MRHRVCLGPILDLFSDLRCDRISAFRIYPRGKFVMRVAVIPFNKNGEGFSRMKNTFARFSSYDVPIDHTIQTRLTSAMSVTPLNIL
jgi:hypothetical protein